MRSDVISEIVSLIEAQAKSRPSPIEFQMAYQIRVAIDCIRFAIKATDKVVGRPPELQEAGLQLLDALDRLESADRSFKRSFRATSSYGESKTSSNDIDGKERDSYGSSNNVLKAVPNGN